MAASSRVTIGTTAAQIVANPAGVGGLLQVWLKVPGANPVTLGGDNTVTTANGFDLAAAATIGPIELEPGDEIFGIAGQAGNVVQVLTV